MGETAETKLLVRRYRQVCPSNLSNWGPYYELFANKSLLFGVRRKCNIACQSQRVFW